MRYEGEGLGPKGLSRQVIWIILVLFISGIILTGQATAPVTTCGESYGTWCDHFGDESGIEICCNVTIEDGHVSLLTAPEETHWEKKGVAVENGDPFDFLLAKKPSVIKEGNIYKMWYAGLSFQKSRILYATSTDCVNWDKNLTPVLNVGLQGEPDDTHLNAPTVINDNGMYKMWYAGNDGFNDRIMYTTSSNGINWGERRVVLEGQDPIPNTVIMDGGQYKMWYQALEDGHWKIFYATSQDGINWMEHGRALDTGDPGQPDDMHVTGASVLKDEDGSYRMWYSGHDEETGYRIFYATGNSEMDWTKHGMAIDQGNPGGGDDKGAAYPCVIKDDDLIYKVWYMGTEDDLDAQIMHAICLPFTREAGSIRSLEITLPPGQSWDRVVIEKIQPGMDNHIFISVLDGATGEPISGFEKIYDQL